MEVVTKRQDTEWKRLYIYVYIYMLYVLCYISHMQIRIHAHILSSLSFFLTKSSVHQMMRKALCLHQAPWGVCQSAILHHKSVQLCNKPSLSLSLCIRTHTHTLHVGYLDLSPGVRTRHLESPKIADGPNLRIHISVCVYKLHMYISVYVYEVHMFRKRKAKDVNVMPRT